MKQTTVITVACLLLAFQSINAQTKIQGYLFEENNRGPIENVDVKITVEDLSKSLNTDNIGLFEMTIPDQITKIRVSTNHYLYQAIDTTILIDEKSKKQYIKIELVRKPGYDFDVVLTQKITHGLDQIEGITGAKIEVYNNTTQKEVFIVDSLEHPNFKFKLEQGNHYTMLIRKKGYLDKRLEANINVDGCILCFDGLNLNKRNAMDVLTKGNKMGTILANIEMIPNIQMTTLELKNIHYDYDKWAIRPDAAIELDKAIAVIQQNKVSFVELGSHTDARGSDEYNLNLSQKRAESAVNYIIDQKGIEKGKIFAKGYGESQIVNKCLNGVKCSNEEHELNRRTIVKVHVIDESEISQESLKEIILHEKILKSIEGTEVFIKPDK